LPKRWLASLTDAPRPGARRKHWAKVLVERTWFARRLWKKPSHRIHQILTPGFVLFED